MSRHPASFRDPAGQLHISNGRVLRTVLPPGAPHYEFVKTSGFFEAEAGGTRLISGVEVEPSILTKESPEARYVVEHPRLEFISHPYEWSFAGLQAAAVLTLDLHLAALERGVTMSDASAFNVQFAGPRPIFIDYLSFLRYETGQLWFGYRQFCEQFLNPLLLTAITGVPFQPMFRGTLEGIRADDLARLLPFRSRLDPRVVLHVRLQAKMQRTVTAGEAKTMSRFQLPRAALENNLRSMRRWITGLAPPDSYRSPWQDYEKTANYTDQERARKAQFVAEAIEALKPRIVWDFGCNSGQYAELALASGAGLVIGFEPDPGALNAAFRRAATKDLNFLPLHVDIANPSPGLGWRERERAGLWERRNADLVMALALIHHLILGRNVPTAEVIDWLVAAAPNGIVEFVPKADPMAKQLLALKPDIAPDYELERFRELLSQRARIVGSETVTGSGRTMFSYARA